MFLRWPKIGDAALDASAVVRHPFRLILFGLDELVARNPHPHDQGAGHQYGRVDAEQNADGECEGEVVQGNAPKNKHGSNHHLRTAVSDDGARDGAGNGMVEDFRR